MVFVPSIGLVETGTAGGLVRKSTKNKSKSKRKPADKRNCRNCYFARLIADRLHCVKNEPVIDYETGCARWPAVKDDDICGRFRCAGQNHIDADH